MHESLSIRAATRDDLPDVLTLIRELAAFEKLAHEVTATEADLEQSLFEEPRRAEVLLAYTGDELVGFALFFHNFSTFLGRSGLYLEDLFVRPHARGRGIGTALMRDLARIARERNCGRMEWWVLDWNRDAQQFYDRIGAQPMDDWTVYRLDEAALHKLI